MKIAVMGTSGSGKTYSSLLLAKGLASDPSKIALVDSENGSGELYSHLYPYGYLRLDAPFQPTKYVEAIRAAVDAGMEVLIIDSLTHAWKFILNYKETLDQNNRGGFKNWGVVKPLFDELKIAILESPIHVIVTMRSKAEYAVEQVTNQRGDSKSEVRKLGTGAVMEPDAEYEFSVVLDVNREHLATTITTGKDRTGLFANEPSFRISEDTGRKIRDWLGGGLPPTVSPAWDPTATNPEVSRLEAAATAPAAANPGESPETTFLKLAFAGEDLYREFCSRCTTAEVSWKKIAREAKAIVDEVATEQLPEREDVVKIIEARLEAAIRDKKPAAETPSETAQPEPTEPAETGKKKGGKK